MVLRGVRLPGAGQADDDAVGVVVVAEVVAVAKLDVAVRVHRAEQGQVVRRPVAVQVERVGRLDQVEDQRQVGVVEVRTRDRQAVRSEEHTSELQSLMRISYAVFCLKKKKTHK